MKHLSSIKATVAWTAVLTAMTLSPCCRTQAQTSKSLGTALSKGLFDKRKISPMKEQAFDTSALKERRLKLPASQASKKTIHTNPVSLGYGNSMLFRDMNKLKRDTLKRDTLNADKQK